MTTRPTHIWNPIRCTLQLVFPRPSNGTAIVAGSTYQGISIIRYRCEPYHHAVERPEETESSSSSPSPVNTEFDEFARHRRLIAEKNALHFHALTTAGGIYKDAGVLDVQSYQVRRAYAADGAATGVLKVLSVEVEDGETALPGAGSIASTERNKKISKSGKKKSGAAMPDTAQLSAGSSGSVPTVDWGSKLVIFEDAGSAPPFCEVELTIQFVGTVQAFDHGGIYAARGSDGTEDVPLLTHFEVRYARCAFPSPDDPQYRLEWHLKSIQLPSVFCTILTNGEMRSRKEVVAQQAVQMSFAPCGPLPAYVFSFACFPYSTQLKPGDFAVGGLEVVEGTTDIPHMPGDMSSGVQDRGALSCTSIPVRVLARPEARIAMATLERVLDITIEAVRALQELFQCPLPLRQCEHLDVLLGPTMPFISGMEHHCSIVLNETIYQESKRSSVAGSGAGGSVHGNREVEQTELIVHELTHHWIGNALGLPFAVKEGICQVIEQCVGDTLLGKPMRRYKADGDGSVSAQNSSSPVSSANVPTSTIKSSKKGHEFTGASYQDALNAIKRLVAHQGFDRFVLCLRHLLHLHVITPAIAVEDGGGIEALRCIGADIPPPPYLSTDQFLRVVKATW
ncbi:hypothetical protein JKF63_03945 [Porcisia hertigi]|uniref:Aminopeptidase n=1 Tax=Porcisia hertigi TaxID=2761500 RepID=A0A836HU95_9TRYP|nr:hypothetical protein JKF63_03945 [Porcisia hertigi]